MSPLTMNVPPSFKPPSGIPYSPSWNEPMIGMDVTYYYHYLKILVILGNCTTRFVHWCCSLPTPNFPNLSPSEGGKVKSSTKILSRGMDSFREIFSVSWVLHSRFVDLFLRRRTQKYTPHVPPFWPRRSTSRRASASWNTPLARPLC